MRAECQEIRNGRHTNVQDFVMIHVGYEAASMVDDLGLPNWGGTLETMSSWTLETIEISVYTIEYQLQHRTTDKIRTFLSEGVGSIFKKLLQEAQMDQDMGITYGHIWRGGRSYTPTFNAKPLWDIYTEDLIGSEACDIRFVPQIVDDRIVFQAEMYDKLGGDLSEKICLYEGKNVHDIRYTEQGPIINEWMAIGSGSTWGEDMLSSISGNETSIQKYGLRQGSEVYSQVSLQGTLDRFADAEVKSESVPHKRIALTCLNKKPALWAGYGLGDWVMGSCSDTTLF